MVSAIKAKKKSIVFLKNPQPIQLNSRDGQEGIDIMSSTKSQKLRVYTQRLKFLQLSHKAASLIYTPKYIYIHISYL